MITEQELMRLAFQALLDGKPDERDRLIKLVEHQRAQRIRVLEGGGLGSAGEPIELVAGADGVHRPRA